ncbi:hypothetical protein EST38_g6623 [Candolleomyces aberdarensis]|uniref:Uncharacterized protein n=1 Tax=Candolleomyces aberdarensis TaxID=2316362 RepID=A0A4V1Q3N7_9AGAR|nr:hypothetical protein EST38_g6623 [Candolleomyces aberdarensis]
MSDTSAAVSPSDPTGSNQNDPVPDLGFDYVDEETKWGDKPPANRDGRGENDKKIKVVRTDDKGEEVPKKDK